MAVEDRQLRDRSYFFRAHKNCWELATQDEKTLIESSVIDRTHWMPLPPPPTDETE